MVKQAGGAGPAGGAGDMMEVLHGLDICAGSGIGSWAFEQIGLCRTVCYIENDPYCQRLLQHRMRCGDLAVAPVWDDLKTFDGRPWRGCVDFMFGGIPCQPWSVAGKGGGHADERDLWPDFLRVLGEIRPRLALVENVPGLLSARNRACICGWSTRWGGVHPHSAQPAQQARQELFPGDRCKHDNLRTASTGEAAGHIRRQGHRTSQGNSAVGCGVELAYLRGRCSTVAGSYLPLSDPEKAARQNLSVLVGDDSGELSWRQAEEVDGAHENARAGVSECNRSLEPERTKRRACPVCGRALDFSSAQTGWVLGGVCGDLAEVGYDAESDVVGAWEVGAPHRRDRLWIVAYPQGGEGDERKGRVVAAQAGGGRGGDAAPELGGEDVSDADSGAASQRGEYAAPVATWHTRPDGCPAEYGQGRWVPGRWAVEPDVGRVAHGIPRRVDRLRVLGNAWVPQVAMLIGRRIRRAAQARQEVLGI